MAKHLNAALLPAAIARTLAALLYAAGSLAQDLADPTRPPAMAGANDAAQAASQAAPALQSVLISPLRAEAIISGRTVRVGDRIGDAKVLRISESEVVLRNGKGLQTLRLFPGIEKRANFGHIGNIGTKEGKRGQ